MNLLFSCLLVFTKHTQLLWQFQKFALGLDVIGNPAQLVSTFQTGAKDLVSFSQQVRSWCMYTANILAVH